MKLLALLDVFEVIPNVILINGNPTNRCTQILERHPLHRDICYLKSIRHYFHTIRHTYQDLYMYFKTFLPYL